MISAIDSAGLRGRVRPGTLKRLAPPAALLVLFALAIGFELSQDAQIALSRSLSTAVRRGVAEGGLVPLAEAGLALGLWLAWLSARWLAFFGAFLAVEIILVGPPSSWRAAGFGLAVQVALMLFYHLIGPVLNVALPYPFAAGPLVVIEQARLQAALGPMAPILLALASLMAFGFVGYWIHRAQHAFPLLWRFHRVHHSVERLDALTGYAHPFDVIGQRIGAVTVTALLGFRFDAVLWILALQNLHERMLHTRAPVNWGFMGRVFVDNRFHFVHHIACEAQSGRNFSGIFTLWDHWFGTYRAPDPNGLAPTGLDDTLPPRTLAQFFLARLDDRPPPA
jgi:sterol desaturase/sphingolipid hydroxylase (fatty acid hydroxylase superfamily)